MGVQRVPWAVSVDDAPSRAELKGESSRLGLNVDSCGAGVSVGAEGDKDGLSLFTPLPEGAPEGGSALENTEPLEPGRDLELLHSSPGCFFCTSAKHLEQRFMVLLDPQNPHGQRGGRLGGLLRSLVSPMTELLLRRLLLLRGGEGASGKPEASSAALALFSDRDELGEETKQPPG